MALIPFDIKQQAAHWLPVCPVHLIADRDTLVLAPTSALGLSLTDAQDLIGAFNAHFKQDGYLLWSLEGDSWWLGSNHAWHLRFPALARAEAMNLRDAWQQGRDAQRWRKLLNEAQMLWFSHAVNVQREALGLLPINGFWSMQKTVWWRRWLLLN